MEQSPTREANRFSATQEIPRSLWNPKVHTAFTSAVTRPYPETTRFCPHPHPTSGRSILILYFHQRLGLPSGLFPSCFPIKTLNKPLLSPIRATCPTHLLLDFITRTILGEHYRSLSSSLCSFLHSPVTSSLLGPNRIIVLSRKNAQITYILYINNIFYNVGTRACFSTSALSIFEHFRKMLEYQIS